MICTTDRLQLKRKKARNSPTNTEIGSVSAPVPNSFVPDIEKLQPTKALNRTCKLKGTHVYSTLICSPEIVMGELVPPTAIAPGDTVTLTNASVAWPFTSTRQCTTAVVSNSATCVMLTKGGPADKTQGAQDRCAKRKD